MAKITWLVPGLIEGSGGHRTILQHANFLQRQGHETTIHLENPLGQSDATLRASIKRIFGFEFADVRGGWTRLEPADMVFATIWYSAQTVRDLPFDCIRCYFVQDYEAMFNAVGSAYVMAENSYRYGLHPIAIGRWLPVKLAENFEIESACFDFCADLDVYRRTAPYRHNPSVCFIHQPEKPRRCAELGIEALGIVKHRMPEVKVVLYGSKTHSRVWFEHENLELIDLSSCNALYNRSGVGLCISTTNPSRIPFEMMAAGLPVVEVHAPNTVYDLPAGAVSLCEPTPESLAKGMLEILGNAERAAAMSRAGEHFMRDRPLTFGLEQFGHTVAGLLDGRPLDAVRPEKMYREPPVRFDPRSEARFDTHSPTIASDWIALDTPGGRLGFLPKPLRIAARKGYRALRRRRT